MPASTGSEMQQFINWINTWSNIKVENIFEIGANFAQDANYLAKGFNVPPENVYVFEAHPDLYSAITKLYKFNSFNYAVYNEEKILSFNAIDLDRCSNTGVSSIRNNSNYSKDMKYVSVQSIRMDNFMNSNNITSIDFLKLDVEGCNYEVLESFGERLKDVKAIHVEAEHRECWEGEKLYEDIRKILESNNFVQIYFQRYLSQSDSFWVQDMY